MLTGYYCLICISLSISCASYKIDTEDDAVHYLSRFGYFEPMDNLPPESAVASYHLNFTQDQENISSLWKAIIKFQTFAGIQPTGTLDAPTMSVMNKPRCGNPDMVKRNQFLVARSKRFSLSSFRWNSKVITYRVMEYPKTTRLYAYLAQRFTIQRVDFELRLAFSFWAEASGLRFINANAGEEVDIEIRFAEMNHGGEPDRNFDGPGTEIAHAFLPDPSHPLHGDIHFDNDEPWISGRVLENTFHFRWAAVHEIGHALGLQHSSENTSYMFPVYPSYYHPAWKLHRDDVLGIRALYPDLNRNASQPMIPEVKTKTTTLTPIPRVTPYNTETNSKKSTTEQELELDKTMRMSKIYPKNEPSYPIKINPFVLKTFVAGLQPKFSPYNPYPYFKKSNYPYPQFICKPIRLSHSFRLYYYNQRDGNAVQGSKHICVPFQFFSH